MKGGRELLCLEEIHCMKVLNISHVSLTNVAELEVYKVHTTSGAILHVVLA